MSTGEFSVEKVRVLDGVVGDWSSVIGLERALRRDSINFP